MKRENNTKSLHKTYCFYPQFSWRVVKNCCIFFHCDYQGLHQIQHIKISIQEPFAVTNIYRRGDESLTKNKNHFSTHESLFQQDRKRTTLCTLFLLRSANARAPSPPQASRGSMTLSTSPANMQSLPSLLTVYCGALLSPARTQGKNVYPICVVYT